MEIKPIKSRRTTEIILEQIKNFMLQGQLNPGDKLPTESILAEKFEVSRTSIREALSALNLTGILDIRQGEGIYVNRVPSNAVIEPLSFLILLEKDLGNILEVGMALEVEAAGLSALNRDEKDLVLLQKLLNQMDTHIRLSETSQTDDDSFHLALAGISKNPLLERLINTTRETAEQVINATYPQWFQSYRLNNKQDIYLDHQNIVLAIQKSDDQLANQLMHEHLTRAAIELRRYEKLKGIW